LPRAISGINSFWQRGYGDPPPQTLNVVGIPRRFMERTFSTSTEEMILVSLSSKN
jgi:hypothetical protein